MSHQKLLLRVPELGAALGKLIGATPRAATWIPLDAVRLRLATRVLEHGGEARELAANDEPAAALAALGSTRWREAWDEAVALVVEQIVERVDSQLQDEARAVRMGRRRRARLNLGVADRRAIGARIGSTGAGLMPALDALERESDALTEAGGTDGAEEWQQALVVAAGRLEASWLDLERAVDEEGLRWHSVADQVAGWRKSLWPVAVVGVVLVGAATWFGLILGGYLEPPRWLARAWVALFGQ